MDLRFLSREPPAGRRRGDERRPIKLGTLCESNYEWFSSLENLSLTDEATAIEEARLFGRPHATRVCQVPSVT